MAGYAKRLMDEAQRWLKANPDPRSPKLRVPEDSPNRVARAAEAYAALDRGQRREVIAELLRRTGPEQSERQKAIARLEEETTRLDEAEKRVLDLNRRATALNEELEEYLNQAVARGFGTGLVPVDSSAVGGTVMLGYWMLRWARDGYNTIDLSPDFAAAMILTDPDGVDPSELRLPFGGVLLTIPDRFVAAGEESFTKIHVCEVLSQTGERRLLEIIASSTSRVAYASAPLDLVTVRGAAAFECGHPADESDHRVLEDLKRLTIATIVYMCSARGALERREGPPRPRGDRRERLTHWDLGRTVRIDPRLVSTVRAGAREAAFRLKHQHAVRGHYREQPVGKGRADRKRIWIAPFWKGPREGAAIVHTYDPRPKKTP